jgi:hypothetical protein
MGNVDLVWPYPRYDGLGHAGDLCANSDEMEGECSFP